MSTASIYSLGASSKASSMFSSGTGLKPIHVGELGPRPPPLAPVIYIDSLCAARLTIQLTAHISKPVDISLEDTPIHFSDFKIVCVKTTVRLLRLFPFLLRGFLMFELLS